MPRFRFPAASAAALVTLIAFAQQAAAQLPQARLHTIFPPGAQAGTEVDVQISGVDLDGADRLLFNHPGLSAIRKTGEVRGKTQPLDGQFTVKVAADVPAGFYEVRTAGLFGLSNPRTFMVGEREQFVETEPNDDPEKAQALAINQAVNARSDRGTDVDWYKFTGKKGQRVLIVCNSARIDSRLDGVIEVYDAGGRRIGAARRSKVWMHGDPVADVMLPADGEYLVQVHDFVYGGGNDYFYRLSVTTAPWIDFVLPPAGVPGQTGQFTLYGRNLPGGQPAGVTIDGKPLEKAQVSIALPNEPATLEVETSLDSVQAGTDGIQYSIISPEGRSNAVLIGFATAPMALEQEPNDDGPQAQKITLPAEIAGQFQKRGDVDWYEFQAKAGEVFMVEVFAQRRGTTADPYIWVDQITKDDKGAEQVKRLTTQDDNTTNLAQNVFDTNSDDPSWKFQVPADGTYRVGVRDRYAQARFDPRLVYRLAIGPEQPDFRVVVVPSQNVNNNISSQAIGLRKGENVSVPVLVFRRDGFDGTVHIKAEGLPAGVTCGGAIVGAGQGNAELIFSAAENAAEWAGRIQVVGTATVNDPDKERALAAAEAAIKPAQDALAKTEQPLKQAEEQLKQAEEQLAKAQENAAKQPENAGLKSQAEAAQKTVDQRKAAAEKARQVKADAEKKLQESLAAVEAARKAKEAAAREVTRQSRAGTVVWDGNQNLPVISRVSRSIGLSVLKEKVPFQVTAKPIDVTVCQGAQVLVPIQIARRDGYDKDLKLAFAGLPRNSNITAPNNITVKKDDKESLLKVFVNNNATVGAYTLYLTAQGQVSYSRNPKAVERIKKEQAAADAQVKTAQEALNKTKATQTEATKTLQESQQAAQKAKTDLDTTTKQEAANVAKAKQAYDQAEQVAKTAEQAKTAAEATLKAAADEAAKKAAETALAEATKKLEESQKAAQTAKAALEAAQKQETEKVAAAKKAQEEADATAKAAEKAKTEAEAAVKAAEAEVKKTTDFKKQIDAEVKKAEDAAKPKNINLTTPSTPVLIRVKEAPAQLSASVPSGGNIKRGNKLEIKVTVKRLGDFTGPVTLSLPLPPNVTGLSAAEVTVPADQTEGVLVVQAGGDATEGQLENMVIHGTMDHHGQAAIDVPVTIKVSK